MRPRPLNTSRYHTNRSPGFLASSAFLDAAIGYGRPTRRLLMIVPMMQIRHVRMRVPHRLVYVLMNVGLGSFIAVVGMLVMLVVHMAMGMFHVPVLMLVRVRFG